MGTENRSALIIGGDGGLGRALFDHLQGNGWDALATSRRSNRPMKWPYCELKTIPADYLEGLKNSGLIDAGTSIFLVAANPSLASCERHRDLTWRVNVDAPRDLARQAAALRMFPVFVSSDCVEYAPSTQYGFEKLHGEIAILHHGGAVVRPQRIEPNRRGEVCKLLETAALARVSTIYRWSSVP